MTAFSKNMLVEREEVARLPRYSVSKTAEDVAQEYGHSQVTFLASNENPYGCSSQVQACIASGLVHRYPDGSGRDLKIAISEHLGNKPAQIMLGNGSNEVLECTVKAYVRPGEDVIVSQYSFAMYPLISQVYGANIIEAPMENWAVDLSAILNTITEKTRLIFVASVNNPTGALINKELLEKFLTDIPTDILVVIDEAYIEFSGEEHSMASEINQFPNLLVSRTFSKAYGLAGLRIGYGIAQESLINVLEKVRQPFNINVLAMNAGIASVTDQQFLNDTVSKTRIEMRRIDEFLTKNGFSVLPSDANFLTYSPGTDASAHYEFLLIKGVVVRPLAAYGMSDWVRVSMGTNEENGLFMQAVQQWLESKK